MEISKMIGSSSVLLGFEARNKAEALCRLAAKFCGIHSAVDGKRLLSSLMEREALGSTALGNGVAIPHAKSEEIPKTEGLLAISKDGIDFHALDGEPVHVFFLMVYPKDPVGVHLLALASLAKLLRDDFVVRLIRKAEKPAQVIRIIKEQEARSAALAGHRV